MGTERGVYVCWYALWQQVCSNDTNVGILNGQGRMVVVVGHGEYGSQKYKSIPGSYMM